MWQTGGLRALFALGASPLPYPAPSLPVCAGCTHHGPRRLQSSRLAAALQASGRRVRVAAVEGGGGSASGGKGFGDAPDVVARPVGKEERRGPSPSVTDQDFEQRLAAVKRAAEERKEADSRLFGPIDYDAPAPLPSIPASWTKDAGAKVVIAMVSAVFAAIFAFGDILPPPSIPPTSSPSSTSQSGQPGLSQEQLSEMQTRLSEFKSTLQANPNDLVAVEGAAVTYVELGELGKAEELLDSLLKLQGEAPDVDALRLLGEVKYAQGKYLDSAAVYRRGLQVFPFDGSPKSIQLLQGLTGALLEDNKPKEAVEEVLAVRQQLAAFTAASVDPVPLELLLGQAYLAWAKPGDAVAVYDSLIQSHPNDFRGYLAKGALFQELGQKGEAQRMFVQARFFAPEGAKSFVDRFAK